MHVSVIGIDCATDPKKVGLARCYARDDGMHLIVAETVATREMLVAQVKDWLLDSTPALIALDAPLGWPAALARALQPHYAGAPLSGDTAQLFNRATDRFIHQIIGKKPLDVGADRIARTATAALSLLHQIRHATDESIPLAWQAGPLAESAAIEVYPAATLKAFGLPYTGYKRRNKKETAIRQDIVAFLRASLNADDRAAASMESNDDRLDAALCCLAGLDFLSGNVLKPEMGPDLATEGWIWVRPPTGES